MSRVAFVLGSVPKDTRWVRLCIVVCLIGAVGQVCHARDLPSPVSPAGDPGLFMKVRLSGAVKISKLKPGNVIEGSLSHDMYSADRRLFPAGSHVKLTVDHLEKRNRTADDHWPWVVKAFMPRKENYPVFRTASVRNGDHESSLAVSMIAIGRMREIHAQAKKSNPEQPSGWNQGAVEVSKSNTKSPAALTVVLEASKAEALSESEENNSEAETASGPQTIPAGTRCKILLLQNVSASKSNKGEMVQARLLEPVLLNSRVVLPAGSLITGRVVRKTRPRWLSRPGSLYLVFDEITLPEGAHIPIAASVAGAELDQRSHTRMDAEGELHGDRSGKAWMAINLGVSAGLAKEVDDGTQLIIEALISSATDVSTAGTARVVSICVSGLYMATRHGRDVMLPRFTEMDISLDRPVLLNRDSSNIASAAVARK